MDVETTVEWCHHCGAEVEIPANILSKCPECGNVILPCSTCERACDWTENRGCWRFPLNQKKSKIKEGEINV